MHPFILSSWAYCIFRFFRHLGPFGLLLLGILDSSFLVLPLGNDLLLIALLTSIRPGPVWILYIVMSALGSMLGALLDDLVTRKAGEKGLEKFVGPKQIKKLKKQIEEKAGRVVFITTLLPPPFPFTAVIMTAAALQYPRKKILLLVLAGRLLRFTLVAMLALYFGKRLLVLARHSPFFEYIVYVMVGIAVIGTIATIIKLMKKRK